MGTRASVVKGPVCSHGFYVAKPQVVQLVIVSGTIFIAPANRIRSPGFWIA